MLPPKARRDATVTLEFLHRTRVLSVGATALASMWLFGNLYEALVWNLQLIADPRPGILVGALAVGSPVFYYLPWTPVCVVLAVILRLRFGAIAPPHVRRAWNGVIGCLVFAVVTKVFLITRVNPTFRDPTVPSQVVHDQAVVWAFGNGVTIVAVAAAVVLLTVWRRPRVEGADSVARRPGSADPAQLHRDDSPLEASH